MSPAGSSRRPRLRRQSVPPEWRTVLATRLVLWITYRSLVRLASVAPFVFFAVLVWGVATLTLPSMHWVVQLGIALLALSYAVWEARQRQGDNK